MHVTAPGISARDTIPCPSIVSWNVTSQCSLHCPHCYLDAGRSRRDELSTAEGKSLIDSLVHAGTRLLILSGGEPLKRMDIFEFIHYGREKGLRVAMGTSGVILDRKTARLLGDAGISSVAISLDSLIPAVHDRFRGLTGAWQKATGAIEACRSENIPVQINITVSNENYHEIDDLISFGKDIGVHNFQVFLSYLSAGE